jgi:hypothetical protein
MPYLSDIAPKDLDQICSVATDVWMHAAALAVQSGAPNRRGCIHTAVPFVFRMLQEEALMHIPPLGPHYTQAWAADDQREDGRRKGGAPGGSGAGAGAGASVSRDGVWLHGVHPVFASFPPLMRRLFDALADHVCAAT